jgi:hypothetical protein
MVIPAATSNSDPARVKRKAQRFTISNPHRWKRKKRQSVARSPLGIIALEY